MILLLFLLFTVVPLVELWLLVKIGMMTSAWTAIGLVLLTGVVGTALARWQGWRVMNRLQTEVRQGILPAAAMIDGVLVLMAGLLLITPGILTDAVGLALLLPPVRSIIRGRLKQWMKTHVQVEAAHFWQSGAGPMAPGHDEIVDAHVVSSEVEEENERPKYPNTQ